VARKVVPAARHEHHRLVIEHAPDLEAAGRDDGELGQLLSPLVGLLGFGLGAFFAWISGRRARG